MQNSFNTHSQNAYQFSSFQFCDPDFLPSLLSANMAAGQLDPGINNAQGIQRAVM